MDENQEPALVLDGLDLSLALERLAFWALEVTVTLHLVHWAPILGFHESILDKGILAFLHHVLYRLAIVVSFLPSVDPSFHLVLVELSWSSEITVWFYLLVMGRS